MREYWQFDPTGDYLRPPLQGLELIGGRYERLPAEKLADGTLRLESRVLGLEVRQEAEGLRFYDPATRSYLLSSEEVEEELQLEAAARRQAEAARSQAEARLQDEATARRQAEARIAELEAMLRERGENDTPPGGNLG